MLKMTVEEKAAYKWALAEEEGPTCSRVLAEYIKRNLEGEIESEHLADNIDSGSTIKEDS